MKWLITILLFSLTFVGIAQAQSAKQLVIQNRHGRNVLIVEEGDQVEFRTKAQTKMWHGGTIHIGDSNEIYIDSVRVGLDSIHKIAVFTPFKNQMAMGLAIMGVLSSGATALSIHAITETQFFLDALGYVLLASFTATVAVSSFMFVPTLLNGTPRRINKTETLKVIEVGVDQKTET